MHEQRNWDSLNRRIVDCRNCPRLIDHCHRVASEKRRAFLDWDYWGRPVPNFGDSQARLLIVGLAPAAHGANRTGRMFTGDRSGDWLYRALYKAGFANLPTAESVDDGLALSDCAITAVCHCAPPGNRPTRDEIVNCSPFLIDVLDQLPVQVIVALGQLAWNEILREAKRRNWLTGARPKFGHGHEVSLADQRWLVGSYHPSQQNTFTGRLTEPMLDQVYQMAKKRMR